MGIIAGAIGVSSNGRTRDFGSLYHGSNPCAPTKIKQCPQGHFFVLNFGGFSLIMQLLVWVRERIIKR